MSFNKSQTKAINHLEGPALILAGPGSGKTLVITHRTQKLINEYGVNPSEILVITFTKAAALEMEERFIKINDGRKPPVSFGTFHSVFFKILKYAYNLSAANILGEVDKWIYIKEIIDSTEMDVSDESEFIAEVLSEISNVKSEMTDVEKYQAKSCPIEVFRKVFKEYDRKLKNKRNLDFDDMLVMCFKLLSERKDILNLWQNKYKYILIDEFQDINRVQYEVIKLLAMPENNLFIVGDDDQSIYRFRGAKPEIMLGFENEFSAAVKIVLDTNYRSTKEIVELSGKIIGNNKKRFSKHIISENTKGQTPDIKSYVNQTEESNGIINKIKEYVNLGYSHSDIAILYRTNMAAGNLIENLILNNMAFHLKDSIPSIYEHWISKDILTYIKISLGDNARGLFLKIMNRPKRYISREVLDEKIINLEAIKCIYSEKEYVLDKLEKLDYDLKFIKKLNPFSAINYIRHGVGYEDFLEEFSEKRRVNLRDLHQVLDEIQEKSKPFKTFQEWFLHIEDFNKQLKTRQKKKNNNTDSIEISTMHSSKGLEYKVVFIPDVNEGITPHNKAVLEEDIEEERRLFYVAVTRAKERLHISTIKERFGKDMEVSRFLEEVYVSKK